METEMSRARIRSNDAASPTASASTVNLGTPNRRMNAVGTSATALTQNRVVTQRRAAAVGVNGGGDGHLGDFHAIEGDGLLRGALHAYLHLGDGAVIAAKLTGRGHGGRIHRAAQVGAVNQILGQVQGKAGKGQHHQDADRENHQQLRAWSRVKTPSHHAPSSR